MIRVVVDDLAFVKADAVVRPTTSALQPVSTALRRLEQVGGPSFWSQLKVHDELGIGAAVVTGAGDLTADFVVHAVIQSQNEAVSLSGIRRALVSALQRAADWQLDTLAIPPIGIGPGNPTIEDVAQTMVELVSQVMAQGSFPREVYIVVDSEVDRDVFELYLRRTTQS